MGGREASFRRGPEMPRPFLGLGYQPPSLTAGGRERKGRTLCSARRSRRGKRETLKMPQKLAERRAPESEDRGVPQGSPCTEDEPSGDGRGGVSLPRGLRGAAARTDGRLLFPAFRPPARPCQPRSPRLLRPPPPPAAATSEVAAARTEALSQPPHAELFNPTTTGGGGGGGGDSGRRDSLRRRSGIGRLCFAPDLRRRYSRVSSSSPPPPGVPGSLCGACLQQCVAHNAPRKALGLMCPSLRPEGRTATGLSPRGCV